MRTQLLSPVFALVLLCACEPDGLYDSPISITEKAQVAHGIVVQNKTDNQLELLAVSDRNIRNRVLFTPEEGEAIYDVFAGKEGDVATSVYAVTYPESARQTDLYPTLNVIHTGTGDVTRYKTGSLFGNHHFDPSGKYIIMYHTDFDSSITGGLYNPNEIAIIDLDSAPSAKNPVLESVDIAGHTIENITFFDEVQIGDTVRKLVAFSTEGSIQFTDFNDSAFPSITIALKNAEDSRTIIPSKFELIPAYAGRGPRLFVKASAASEVFDIEFNPKNNAVGFYATTALLDSGFIPSDFALVKDAGALYLVTAGSSTRQLNIFETSTASVTSLLLDDAVDTMFTRAQNGEHELVMFGENSQHVYFLPFSNLGDEMGDNLESLTVPAGVSQAYILDNDRLMITTFSDSNMIIMDLRTRTMTNLSGAGSSNWTSGKLWEDTYFLAKYSQIAYLNIQTGSPGNLALDEPISNLYVFERQGMGVAMHGSMTGRATLFPLEMPTRAESMLIDGFYVDGILNRGEE